MQKTQHQNNKKPSIPSTESGQNRAIACTWKKKLYFDLKRNPNTNWAKRLNKYANLRNNEYHRHLGLTPFQVYYGRGKTTNSESDSDDLGDNAVVNRLATASSQRERAYTATQKSNKKMVKESSKKHRPSVYVPGEKIYVRSKRRPGVLTKRDPAMSCIILKADYNNHKYVVKYPDGSTKSVTVNDIAGSSRGIDLRRRRVNLNHSNSNCRCGNGHCRKKADVLCSHRMSQACCMTKRNCCDNPNHRKSSMNVKDFTMTESQVSRFIARLNTFERSKPSVNDAYRQMAINARRFNLIPVGNTPRDGHCMFHAVAEWLNKLDNTFLSYEDIRSSVVEWLEANPTMDNGVHLPDFVHNQNLDDYLSSLQENAWGDHITLIAVSHVYQVRIEVVSSSNRNICTFESPSCIGSRTIYLGHESEVHYHRLELESASNLLTQDNEVNNQLEFEPAPTLLTQDNEVNNQLEFEPAPTLLTQDNEVNSNSSEVLPNEDALVRRSGRNIRYPTRFNAYIAYS